MHDMGPLVLVGDKDDGAQFARKLVEAAPEEEVVVPDGLGAPDDGAVGGVVDGLGGVEAGGLLGGGVDVGVEDGDVVHVPFQCGV